ncbi:hypothetical protein Tco_1555940 [Tanacetum coccineum]
MLGLVHVIKTNEMLNNPMNEFAPHRLPQPKGNMNGWLIEDEEEVERNEVDSDLESTAHRKPCVEKFDSYELELDIDLFKLYFFELTCDLHFHLDFAIR